MTVFNKFAADTTELRKWLGIDGSLSEDVGDLSHLWNGTVLTPPDEGTLAVVNSDMVDGGGGATLTKDPNIGSGARDILTYTDKDTFQTSTLSVIDIPDPRDGTRSFILGMIYKVATITADTTIRIADGCPMPLDQAVVGHTPMPSR